MDFAWQGSTAVSAHSCGIHTPSHSISQPNENLSGGCSSGEGAGEADWLEKFHQPSVENLPSFIASGGL